MPLKFMSKPRTAIETIRALLCSVAGPGLSRRGGRGGSVNSKGGGTNPLFGQIFLENCMKIGGRGPTCPLDYTKET